jgi:hypothetical protein
MKKNKNDTKLLGSVTRLLKFIATEAYAAGEGFEFEMAEQDVINCLEELPLPRELKQVRGAIYQSKGQEDIKNRALQMVTRRASESAKLTDEVALYILSSTDDLYVGRELASREDLSEDVREKAKILIESNNTL